MAEGGAIFGLFSAILGSSATPFSSSFFFFFFSHHGHNTVMCTLIINVFVRRKLTYSPRTVCLFVLFYFILHGPHILVFLGVCVHSESFICQILSISFCLSCSVSAPLFAIYSHTTNTGGVTSLEVDF